MEIELLKAVRSNIHYLTQGQPDFAEAVARACDNFESGEERFELPYLLQLARYPVSIDEFIFGKAYLAKEQVDIFPEVLKELRAINNPGGLRVVNPYTEGVFTGGIGSAKSTTALYTTAYQLYVLSCYRNPHRTFGMDPSSEIVFIFQSLSGQAAKEVDYDRFYAMVKNSAYFTTTFPYDTKLKSQLRFPNRVLVRPIGTDKGTIGQNVIGGMIDELNFMAVVQNSRKEADRGVYDQAKVIYDGISRRRKSRFAAGGRLPGILCLVSSKRYPGEFTDQKIEEAKTDPTIYVYDKRVWEVKPEGTFTSGDFPLFIGDATRKAKILDTVDGVAEHDRHLIMMVPNDFKRDFEIDMIGSLRDIAGVSTLARFPFISNREAVGACFNRRKSILNFEETDMETTQLMFFVNRFTDLDQPRWIHCDLGLTADSAGVSCGFVKRFVQTEDGLMMPELHYDFQLRVRPPPNKEIQFHRVRSLIQRLKSEGLGVKWVSFDTFQSADSIQLLRIAGFSTGRLSMDLTVLPYTVLKTALYQDRVRAPTHEHCVTELLSLEQNAKTGKIDHPPNGSKDVADSMAGVAYGLTTRREIWAKHGIPLSQGIAALREIKTKEGENAPPPVEQRRDLRVVTRAERDADAQRIIDERQRELEQYKG